MKQAAWGQLAISHKYAALTQRFADLLSKSLENYDACLALSDSGEIREARNRVVLEMEQQWTGSSGKLTPGC
jgi:hypothetical protein